MAEAIINPCAKLAAAFGQETRFAILYDRKYPLNYTLIDEIKQRYMASFCYLLVQLLTLYGHWMPISKRMSRYAPSLYEMMTRTCGEPGFFCFDGTSKLNDTKSTFATNIPVVVALFLNMYCWDRKVAINSPVKQEPYNEYVKNNHTTIDHQTDTGEDFFDLTSPIRTALLTIPLKETGMKPERGRCVAKVSKLTDFKTGNHIDAQWDELTKFQIHCKFTGLTFHFHEYLHALCTGGFKDPKEVEFFNMCWKLEEKSKPVPSDQLVAYADLKKRNQQFARLWETIETTFTSFDKTRTIKGETYPDYTAMLNSFLQKDSKFKSYVKNIKSLWKTRPPLANLRNVIATQANPPEPTEEGTNQEEEQTGADVEAMPTDDTEPARNPEPQSNVQQVQATVQQVQATAATENESGNPSDQTKETEVQPHEGLTAENPPPLIQSPKLPPHANIDAKLHLSTQKMIRSKKKTINSAAQDLMAQGLYATALEATELHYPSEGDSLQTMMKTLKGGNNEDLYKRVAFMWHQTALRAFSEKLKQIDPEMKDPALKTIQDMAAVMGTESFLHTSSEVNVANDFEISNLQQQLLSEQGRVQELDGQNRQLKLELQQAELKAEHFEDRYIDARELMMEHAVTVVTSTKCIDVLKSGGKWDDGQRLSVEECLPIIENDVVKRARQGDYSAYKIYSEWLDSYVTECINEKAKQVIVDPISKCGTLGDNEEQQKQFAKDTVIKERELWVGFFYDMFDSIPRDPEKGGKYLWKEYKLTQSVQMHFEAYDCSFDVSKLEDLAPGDEQTNDESMVDAFIKLAQAAHVGGRSYIKMRAEKFMQGYAKDDPSISPPNWYGKQKELQQRYRGKKDGQESIPEQVEVSTSAAKPPSEERGKKTMVSKWLYDFEKNIQITMSTMRLRKTRRKIRRWRERCR